MPMPVPGVWQQNCEVGQESVVELGGHGIVSLTIIPESVTAPLVPLMLEPVAPVVPVVPVVEPAVVPLVPVAVPELPVAVPLVPEEPLLEEPPQATPTATATSELRRIVRTGFKTRYLRRT